MKLSRILTYLFVLLTIYTALFIYSLSKVDVLSVDFNEITDISKSGFNLSMDVGIINNGILPVKIKNIDYSIELDSTKEILSEGTVKGSKLSPKEENNFRMNAKVNWKPGIETISGMISEGETNATISGNAHVMYLGMVEFNIPFKEKRDIEPMLKEAMMDKAKDIIDGLFW